MYLCLGAVFLYGALLQKNDSRIIPEAKGQSFELVDPEAVLTPLWVESSIIAKASTQISVGVITTDQGDDLLVLINKHIGLPADYEPKDLVYLDSKVEVARSGLRLRKEATVALEQILKVAKKQGMSLSVLSGYRSFWEQDATFSYWVALAGLDTGQKLSARPGHSQHQLGTTVDFTNQAVGLDISENFMYTKEWEWLAKNAYKFGYVLSYPKGKEAITGYVYEPWHYRFIGVENAVEMVQSGLILEEFLQKFGVV